jgi:hypothetical protein
MASGKNDKGAKTTAEHRRRRVRKNIDRLKSAEEKGAVARVAELEKLLEKTDKELEDVNEAELGEAMDVDGDEAESPKEEETLIVPPAEPEKKQDGTSESESGKKSNTSKPAESDPVEEADGKKKGKAVRSVEVPQKKVKLFETDDSSTEMSDSGAETSGSEMFVSDSSKRRAKRHKANVYTDPELGEALYTVQVGTTTNQNGVTFESVAWANESGRKLFLNRFIYKNKKGVARYRLCESAASEEYETSPPAHMNASSSANRCGDERLASGGPKYTRRHIRAILGVAWKCDGLEPDRDDLNLIDPDLVTSYRGVRTYVLVVWQVGKNIEDVRRSWETRQALRERLGKEKADKLIYNCASDAEDKWEERVTGRRTATTRSPSVSAGLAKSEIKRHREESLRRESKKASKSPSPRATRSSKSPAPNGTDTDIERLRLEFMTSWFELLGMSTGDFTTDFKNLDRAEKRDCVAAWQEEKAAILAN